jgi:hypothetical protein
MQLRHRFLITALTLAAVLSANVSHAAGIWNGQDLLHVPISWCIVNQSPAHAAPDVAGDTTTDALIWRRHERPTDNIYINQAGISFRSAINDAWNVLDFPIIPDPDTALATVGDMRGEDVNIAGTEFNDMLNSCDVEWANMGRAGIGITAVNAGLFHDALGEYVGVIGWGGCVEDVLNPGFCVNPWDGQIVVVDNHYLFPTVPDRTFPDGSGLQFALTDPFDQLVGHELGHALSLPHRNNVFALMNPGPEDNVGADNQSDNVALNNAEVNSLRLRAQDANGLEIDPPNLFIPGNVAAMTQPDPKRDKTLAAHLDLSAVKATFNTDDGTFSLGQRLFGVLPETAAAQSHWFLVDSDGPEHGATAAQLKSLGVPETDFIGADVVIRADLRGNRANGGSAWRIVNGAPQVITGNVRFRLLAMVMHPHFADITGRNQTLIEKPIYPVYHVVSVTMPREFTGISAGQTINAHALVVNTESKVVDRLDPKETGRGTPFHLTKPTFPHCYPQGEAAPGQTVNIDFDGLKPERAFHALLGARHSGRGTTDQNGEGTFAMTIPQDTKPGLHLVTIGVDRTALTADCTVVVRGTQK